VNVALDTNILAYASGVNDDRRRLRADQIITAIGATNIVLPSQVAGELFNVLTRKARRSRQEAWGIVEDWIGLFGLTTYSSATFSSALQLAADHSFQVWDALVVCIADEAGCRLLLSEDMQDGFVYRGVTVANPFAETLHPLLASVLATLSTPGAPR
jgi:predicted nucleic acid-binding protein